MQFSSLLDSAARGRKRPNVPTRTQHSQTEHRHAHKVSRPHCSAYGTLCTGCSTTTLTVEYVLELVYETSTRLLQLYSSRSQTDTSIIPSERSRFDGLPIDTPAPRARERGRSSQLAVLEPFGFVPFTARCPRANLSRSVYSTLATELPRSARAAARSTLEGSHPRHGRDPGGCEGPLGRTARATPCMHRTQG